ncbi:C40 family peptidase [Fictibacillus gelatini]|uniref:C40 family peptidase n=1 Tax=Fictibacillus gelatini TaxID=225985 RepID=UPI0003FA5D54|nr:C40 family peptidase [Fictibacillus gelatini]
MKKLVMGTVLAGILAFNPIVGHAALGDHTLKQGMNHKEVKDLQEVLKKKGYFTYKGKTTTYYGKYTTAAVKKLQKAKKLKVDGIAGPQVFKALGVKATKSSSSSRSYSPDKLVSTAKKYIGVPYRWGGTSPSGFDCSGYVGYVFDKATSINLPRSSSAMYLKGTKVSKPSKGDLVFFNTSGKGVSHVGIYIGDNKFISATSSKGVKIDSLHNTYWGPRYVSAKKM